MRHVIPLVTNAVILGLLAVASVGLGVLGVLIGLRRGRACRPIYSKQNTSLIANLSQPIPGLKVTFDDLTVPVISVMMIPVVNAGAGPLRRENLLSDVVIRSTPGKRILLVEVTECTDPKANITAILNADGTRATIHIDCLRRSRGIVIRIVHTGKSIDDIVLDGETISGEFEYTPSWEREDSFRNLRLAWTSAMLSLGVSFAHFTIINIINDRIPEVLPRIPVFFVAYNVLILVTTGLFFMLPRIPFTHLARLWSHLASFEPMVQARSISVERALALAFSVIMATSVIVVPLRHHLINIAYHRSAFFREYGDGTVATMEAWRCDKTCRVPDAKKDQEIVLMGNLTGTDACYRQIVHSIRGVQLPSNAAYQAWLLTGTPDQFTAAIQYALDAIHRTGEMCPQI
jgi:hypothetical protein